MLNFTLKGLIFTFLVWIALNSHAQTVVTPCEDFRTREALLELYKSAGGNQWTHTWDTASCNFCGWYGIGCINGKVQSINLYYNNLSGVIPQALGNLNELNVIYLDGNQLAGEIPESIGRLQSLRILDLSNNQLSGILPESIGNLINLRYLNISQNNLTGALPQSLTLLSNIQTLNLSTNALSGKLPIFLSNWTSLRTINLAFNTINDSLPEALGQLISLENINLQHNRLYGKLPSQLGDLFKLQSLLLNNNQLSGCYAENLTGLCFVPVLDLSNNPGLYRGGNFIAFCREREGACSSCQDGIRNGDETGVDCGGMHCPACPSTCEHPDRSALLALYKSTGGLNWFNKWDTGQCNVCLWPGIVCAGDRVTELHLPSNNLVGSLPAEIGDLPYLEVISLHDNQLTGGIPLEIGQLSKLKALFLKVNQLQGSVPVNLINLAELQELDLSANNLSGCIDTALRAFCERSTVVRIYGNPGLPYGGNFAGFCFDASGSCYQCQDGILNGDEFKVDCGGTWCPCTCVHPNRNDLMALYYHLDGANWINKWDTTSCQVCSWPGIVCDDEKIISINLYNQGLQGILPPEIGHFKDLLRLDLSNNSIRGELPLAIHNLQNLTHLNLSENQITGHLPPYSQLSPHLSFLALSYNKFYGCYDASYKSVCTNNIAFTLQGNPDLPDGGTFVSFCQTNYGTCNQCENGVQDGDEKGIDCGGTQCPRCIVDCNHPDRNNIISLYTALEGPQWYNPWDTLECDVCNWYGVECEDGRVVRLKLRGNNLRGRLPAVISQFDRLIHLDVSLNQIESLPSDNFVGSQLVFIDLSLNRLSGTLPSSVGQAGKLRFLYLNNNQITGSIPDDYMDQHSTLQVLDLSNNQLTGLLPRSFGEHESLFTLNLSNNQLSGCFPISYAGHCTKNFLFFGNSGLSFAGDFTLFCSGIYSACGTCRDGLINNDETDVDCGGEYCAPCEFKACPHPDRNALLSIYNSTGGERWINTWDTASCDVCKWYGVNCEGDRVTALQLYNNNLTGTIPLQIRELNRLHTLYLDGNNLHGPISNTIAFLNELRALDLSYNQFTERIPFTLSRLTNLRYLNLNNNQLRDTLPQYLGNLKNLEVLLLRNNSIFGPLPQVLAEFPNLKILDLSSNNLSGSLPTWLGRMQSLVFLDLSANTFSGEIPSTLTGLNNLDVLNLSNNSLSGCFDSALGLFCNLSYVDFYNNPGLPYQGDFSLFCQEKQTVCSSHLSPVQHQANQRVELPASELDQWQIFPNPVSRQLYFSGLQLEKNTSILASLYNGLGKIIFTGELSSKGIFMQNYFPGPYYLVLRQGSLVKSFKIIKQ